MTDDLTFRSLEPQDRPQLKAAHYELFPIDYEDRFFALACNGCTEIFSVAVFESNQSLVGFAIGRCLPVCKMEAIERHRLGILDRMWDNVYGSYILTLGVVKHWQKRGIATELINRFEDAARERSSKFLFLHVITYNTSAIALYDKCQYECKLLIQNFYHIRSGRQPEPERLRWDAYLFIKWFMEEDEISDIRRQQTCLGWSLCWPFNAKYGLPGDPVLMGCR